MLEVYLFLAVFLVQILGMSVLYPYQLGRLVREGLKRVPADRVAEHYPGVDVARAHEQFLLRYGTANAVVAILGLVLLGWFFLYMNRPGWEGGRVNGLLTAYFFLQNLPIVLYAWFTWRFNKVHRRPSPDRKRKAMLERRGLFDFVSPFTIVLAVLTYSLFAGFMFYVARHPFPGFAGPLVNIGIVTSGFVLAIFAVYRLLYGRKTDPLQTHSDHMRAISMTVNALVWTCILVPIVVSLSITRQMLDLDAWGPFVGSVVFLTLGLFSIRSLSVRLRERDADGVGSLGIR